MLGMVVVMGPVIMMTMMMTCMSEHILSVISKEIHIMTTKRTASKGEEVTIIIFIFEQIVKVEKSGVALVSISIAAEVERESLLVLVMSMLMCTERLIESTEEVVHVEREWLSVPTSSTLGPI